MLISEEYHTIIKKCGNLAYLLGYDLAEYKNEKIREVYNVLDAIPYKKQFKIVATYNLKRIINAIKYKL